MDYNNILINLDMLKAKLINAEATTSLQLNVSRNILLALNTKIAIYTSVIGFGALIGNI